MNSILYKIFKIVSIILILLAGLFQILVFIKGSSTPDNILNAYMYEAYIAIVLCVLLALIFPVIYLVKNPKNLIRTLIVLGGLVVLGIISYLLSTNNISLEFLKHYNTSLATERFVGSALIYTYIIGGLAIIAIIYSSISNVFK